MNDDVNVAVANLINVPLWDRAGWLGVLWGAPPIDRPAELPICALLFRNADAGGAIFQEWRERLGEIDNDEALRVAVIDGPIAGAPDGYSVNIGSNFKQALEVARQGGGGAPRHVWTVTRTHRMTPAPGTDYVGMFRESFKRKSHYWLMPATYKNGAATPIYGLHIGKREIHFRHVSSVGKHDIDASIFLHGDARE